MTAFAKKVQHSLVLFSVIHCFPSLSLRFFSLKCPELVHQEVDRDAYYQIDQWCKVF